ncbi:MAG: hypothetical protein WD015_07515 [Gaiellaceae bacterium]
MTYQTVTSDFESWDATIHAYLNGSRSISDIRQASQRASASAAGALVSAHPGGECGTALRRYADAISQYAARVGEPVSGKGELYAKAAQGGQAVVDDCTQTWATSARPSQERIKVYNVEYSVCQGITLANIKRDYGFNQAGMTPQQVIMKMERDSYRPEFVEYGFQGCWDAYRHKPRRYP